MPRPQRCYNARMNNILRLSITVKTGKKQNVVKKDPQTGEITVEVKGKPIKGQANKQVVEALAKHFGVPKSSITIKQGLRTRKKLVEIVA